MNDGQHRDNGGAAPGEMTGQISKAKPGAFVGQKSGPEFNMTIKPTKIDADFHCEDHDEHDEY